MPKMIFVNLPVSQLEKSTSFYRALGFELNPHFSDDTASCMVWSETISVMHAGACEVEDLHQPADSTLDLQRGDACRRV